MEKATFIFILIISTGLSIEHVIWNNKSNKFVPIMNIKDFKILSDSLNKEFEQLNHQEQQETTLHLIYFEEKNVFEFYDNDKRATGISGEIWTLLSQYLNVTMTLNKSKEQTMGTRATVSSNFTGLIGLLQHKEFTIIPKMEAFISRVEAVDFSASFWKTEHRLFIQSNYQFKITWMIDIYSRMIWMLILIFYLLLSCYGTFDHKSSAKPDTYSKVTSTADFFFYMLASIFNQGNVLFDQYGKNKRILAITIAMFSWFLNTAYNSQLIVYMSRRIFNPPFDSLEKLFYDTEYILLAEKNSIVYTEFQSKRLPIYNLMQDKNRIIFLSSQKEINKLLCSSNQKYAMFENMDVKKKDIKCLVEPVGKAYFETWIVGGINKKFKNQRFINTGIMRLHEIGLIGALKSRWLDSKVINAKIQNKKFYAPVTIRQVLLVICLYFIGLFMSLVLFIIENIMYFYSVRVTPLRKIN